MLVIFLPLLVVRSSSKIQQRATKTLRKGDSNAGNRNKQENREVIRYIIKKIYEDKDGLEENVPISNGVTSQLKKGRRKLKKITGKVNNVIKTGEELYKESANVIKTGEEVIRQGKKIVHTLEDAKHGNFGETKDPIDVDDIPDDD